MTAYVLCNDCHGLLSAFHFTLTERSNANFYRLRFSFQVQQAWASDCHSSLTRSEKARGKWVTQSENKRIKNPAASNGVLEEC